MKLGKRGILQIKANRTLSKEVGNLLLIVVSMVTVTLFVIFKAYKDRKQFQSLSSMIMDLVHVNDEMHQTLLLGIYHRFLKEDPVEFNRFVGKILEDYYGGKVSVITGEDEYGLDLIQQRNNETYFGKIICTEPDEQINIDPVVFVHSNMVKFGAEHGIVVTTGSFAAHVKKYAEGLNIELIEGKDLVRLWAQSLEKQKEYIPEIAF